MAKSTTKTQKSKEGIISRISGPVVYAILNGSINDLVKVGNQELMGEIIELRGETAVIQVYEDTAGLTPGEKVVNTEKPLVVTLGPGILGGIYDGTQRPLDTIAKKHGAFIPKGVQIPSLDEEKKWNFEPSIKTGTIVKEGEVLGTVKENSVITHRILVPPGISGKITGLKKGKYTIKEIIATIDGQKIFLTQQWPVRKSRPYSQRVPIKRPLITGQRVLDFLYPLAKGGVGAIPGPFGSGKSVTQQQLAKWCDADIIVYIGCGERGNEITEMLQEFPHLKDPKTGESLMNRTILIANTSNMPVAAREASVYTGITIAEYFRDQGYAVALMADSTSRWAEAMREISGRLEEMPGEEGYPAYLAKRLAEFYERAGMVKTLNNEEGSITVIGAVSPPGGDFSEPVTQNTLRIVRCFWGLDAKLADKRHYPSINWLTSYSLYSSVIDPWFEENVGKEWVDLRKRAEKLLRKEAELQEIVQLVGMDALPKDQQFLLFIAKIIREDFLQQNAFDDIDTFCPLPKQMAIMSGIFQLYDTISPIIENINLEELRGSEVAGFIANLKNEEHKKVTSKMVSSTIQKQCTALKSKVKQNE